ncbi:MAG: [LysW]-aminoadipate kinase [Phycisphaeraceae bacterium]|nr:[LysW]-aminoadipate kinase [Phycisphaeraceae bacterium]MCB9847489.1 [LysW]-aminoadipate kinase [Phycisphaeraceae bacterium]
MTVIKIGGGEGIDLAPILEEFAQRIAGGERIVLVHGGSHETNVLSERLGCPPRTITSPGGQVSRRTDRQTLDIFTMVYAGRINKRVVEDLRRLGVDAVGLSGVDGGLWTGERKTAIRAVENGRTVVIRDDLSGKVVDVDASLLHLLLGAGRTPVLTPPAITRDGVAINVDADRAAAMTASALGAGTLLLLSNVPGVLADPADPASLIGRASDPELVRAAAKGRMKNKVLAAEEAIAGGVGRVVIGSANGAGAIGRALSGEGTVFERITERVGA